ncbi:MAG: DHH family phosphoesterase [Oscillospiraceae bacterium]|nr:DHH family phosphoesterase [Oscillospiraceae bacterium]
MNKKLQKIIVPGTRLYLLVMLAFAAVTLFFNQTLAIVEGGIIVLLVAYYFIDARHRQRELLEYIEGVTYDAESAKNNTLTHFPLPIVVFRMSDGQIIWGNQIFFGLFGAQRPTFEQRMGELVPEFSAKWLLEGKNQHPGLVELGGRRYQVHGNIVSSRSEHTAEAEHAENKVGSGFMGITYWVDVTDYDDIRQEYENSRPVTMILVVDNYDELMKNLPDRSKTELRSRVEDKITQWCDGKHGFVHMYDRDRYFFIFENRYLREMSDTKFDILEQIHEIVSPAGIHATLSIGVGLEGDGFEENFSFANLSVETALSRGGDQAVIKNRRSFEFFGGRGSEVETRSKVRSRVAANELAELIRLSSQVLVMGHRYSDMDAIGAAAGMICICRRLGRKAHIVADESSTAAGRLIGLLKDTAEYQDVFITPEDAMLCADSRTLLIVVDTNRPEQVESRPLLESCTHIAVVDHHRRAASYIQNAVLTFHEPYASSTCELLAELLQELIDPGDITHTEAEALLSGIVLDTKNFTIRTGERTFDAAAFLRRMGADTEEVKRLLQNDMAHTVKKYALLQSAKIYRPGVAVAVSETEVERVVGAQAADELLNISGVEASFVLVATRAGGVVISARSIGELNVQLVLEKLGGGGNKSVAGAQVERITLRDAVNTVCAAVDEYMS